jgi:hypothetical protein
MQHPKVCCVAGFLSLAVAKFRRFGNRAIQQFRKISFTNRATSPLRLKMRELVLDK